MVTLGMVYYWPTLWVSGVGFIKKGLGDQLLIVFFKSILPSSKLNDRMIIVFTIRVIYWNSFLSMITGGYF